MATQQKKDNTVTIQKDKYDALVQTARVTSEYLKGNAKEFKNPNELIENLKNNDRSK